MSRLIDFFGDIDFLIFYYFVMNVLLLGTWEGCKTALSRLEKKLIL